MKLPFDADQAVFDEWSKFQRARVEDPDDELHMADYYDMVINFAVARMIGAERPDLVPQLAELVPDHLERVATELGTFMGVHQLAAAVGYDPERAKQMALAALTGT